MGIDDGESMSDRLELLLGSAKFMQGMGLAAKAVVLSGGGRVRARGQEPEGRRADRRPGPGSGPAGSPQKDTDGENGT